MFNGTGRIANARVGTFSLEMHRKFPLRHSGNVREDEGNSVQTNQNG